MRSGSKSDDKKPRLRIAEPGKRSSPVFFICEAPDFLACNFLAPADEAGTVTARDDCAIEAGKCGHTGLRSKVGDTPDLSISVVLPRCPALVDVGISSGNETKLKHP